MKAKRSLKVKIISIFVTLILILVSVITGFVAFTTSELTIALSTSNAKSMSGEIAATVDKYLKGYETIVKSLSNFDSFKNGDEEEMLETLKIFQDIDPDIAYLYVGLENGKMIDTDPVDGINYNPVKEEWYQQTKTANTLLWVDDYYDESVDEFLITVCQPLHNTNGQFIGVIGLDINAETINNLADGKNIGTQGYPIIADENGLILAHPNHEKIGSSITSEALMKGIQSNETELDYEYTVDGSIHKKFAAISSTSVVPWRIISTYYYDDSKSIINQILVFILTVVFIMMIISIIAIIVFSRSITKNIQRIIESMKRVSEGDLSDSVTIKSNDEFGILANYYNHTLEDLANLVGNIKNVSDIILDTSQVLAASSEQVSASSNDVSHTIEEIAEGATSQASDSEQSVQLVALLSERLDQLGDITDEMVQATDKSNEAYTSGFESVDVLIQKNDASYLSSNEIEKVITKLNDHTKEIDKILDAISSVAEQTNLLALNASIEAARAGEHGKGFAVVASEIRKLAEQSSNASDQVRTIMKTIEKESQMSIDTMSTLKDLTEEQKSAVQSVSQSFKLIEASFETVSSGIIGVSKSVESINSDKEMFVTSISNISAVSEETAAASEEVTAAIIQQTHSIEEVSSSAQNLNSVAISLNDEIKKFKI